MSLKSFATTRENAVSSARTLIIHNVYRHNSRYAFYLQWKFLNELTLYKYLQRCMWDKRVFIHVYAEQSDINPAQTIASGTTWDNEDVRFYRLIKTETSQFYSRSFRLNCTDMQVCNGRKWVRRRRLTNFLFEQISLNKISSFVGNNNRRSHAFGFHVRNCVDNNNGSL